MNRKLISNSNFVLRKVINTEKNLDIIKDFIEGILQIEIQKIELNKYLKGRKDLPKEENFGVADVRVETPKEEINVGIQIIDGKYIRNKSLIYYAQIHLNQLYHGKNRKFVRTETINIIDDSIFEKEYYHNVIKIESRDKKEENLVCLHYIELPKFRIRSNKILTKEEQWIAFIKQDANYRNKEVLKNKKILKLDNLLEDYWKKEKME